MSRRSQRRSPAPSKNGHGSSTIYGPDHGRYNEEFEVYDALARATKAYNHDVNANIRLDVLTNVDKNTQYVVVPFIANRVMDFRELGRDISERMQAEVTISSEADMDQDAKIHFTFNILRASFGKSPVMPWWQRYFWAYKERLFQLAILLFLLWKFVL